MDDHPQAKKASFIQRQFWLAQLQDENGSANNIAYGFRLPSNFERDTFAECVRELIATHAVLRSHYDLVDGELHQFINGEPLFELVNSTATLSNPEEAWDEARSHLIDAASKPFDLQTGPLFRLAFVDIACNGSTAVALIAHHIVIDLQTWHLLADSLSLRYTSKKANQKFPEFSESRKTSSYIEYANWQHEWLDSHAAAEALDFWKNHLKGKSQTLPLQSDFQRPSTPSFKGDRVHFSIPSDLQMQIEAYATAKSSDSFIILLAASQMLIHRYTQCSDFLIGVPLTNRRLDNFKNTVGCFVNIVPIATNIQPEDNFDTIVRTVRKSLLLAHRHQEIPIEFIVRAASESRVTDRNPLFQVGYTRESVLELQIDGQTIPSIPLPNGGAQLDLFFHYSTCENKIQGQLEYNTALFKRSTIKRMLANFEVLLRACLREPGKNAHQLEILSKDEMALLSRYNSSNTKAKQRLTHDAIATQAKNLSEKTAVVFENQRFSYRAFDKETKLFEKALRIHNITTGDLVALFIERSAALPPALVAILRTGAAYVPIDPDYPEERVRMILEDANPRVILTCNATADKLPPDFRSRALDITGAREQARSSNATFPPVEVQPEDLAYIIFTSGSTGRPKGVRIRHYSLANFLNAMARRPGMNAGERLLAVTTIAFDIAALEILLPLWVGGSVEIATHEVARDPFLLKKRLDNGDIDLLQATPITWRMLFEAGWQGSPRLKALCGGEAFPPELIQPLVQSCDSVWNMYGPTETTIWSTISQVSENIQAAVPIGDPIDQTQVFILDQNQQPLPVGCVGELYIGGEGLAEGYHLRDDLTHAAFFDSPLANHWREKRIYRTGDLARITHQGNLECLGRADFQVKIRGFRVELAEIETAIKQHPGVANAVVVAKEHRPGEQQLVAYVTWHSQPPAPATEMRQYIGTRLAEYMVPALLVYLDELPLTENGKIDRNALPDPVVQQTDQTDETQPNTETEKQVAAIWRQLLQLDRVGIRNNFFDLGGNSILVVQMQSELNRKLGAKLPTVSLFQYTTIEKIANAIDAQIQSPETDGPNVEAQSRAQRQRNAIAKRGRARRSR